MATKQRKTTESAATTVNLPGVEATFHPPDHIIPTADDVSNAADSVRGYLPSPKMTAWFGGLGLMAVFSVIEWPVAAAIGVGTVVAQRAGSRD